MVTPNRILNKKLFRDLKSNIKQYISIILIAILCVALFTGLLANYKHLNEDVKSIYKDSNVADNFVTCESYDENDQEFLKTVKNVTSISSRFYQEAYYDEKLLYIIATDDDTISKPARIYGGTEVIISKAYAKRRKINIGDTINITINHSLKSMFVLPEHYEELLESMVKSGKENIYELPMIRLNFKVTGLMDHAEAISSLSDSPGIIYMNTNTLRNSLINYYQDNYKFDNPLFEFFKLYLNKYQFINQYLLKGKNIDMDIINDYYINKENNNLLFLSTTAMMPGNQAVELDITQAKKLLYVFPIVFYLVALLIIITSISQSVNKDRSNIGLMTSLGVPKKYIFYHYTKLTTLLIFIGGFLGLIIGPLLIPNIMKIKYNILYSLPNSNHPIIYLEYLLCFLVLILVAFLTSFLISYKLIKAKPATVLRPDNPNFKGLFIEKISFIFKHLSYYLKMSLRNIKRHYSRSIMVIIGIIGCSALLLCGFGIEDTLNNSVDEELNKAINYDVCYTFDEDSFDYNSVSDINFTHLEYVSKRNTLVEFNHATQNVNVYAIDSNSKCFGVDISNDGVTITYKLAKLLNIKKNDTIRLFTNAKTYDYKVSIVANSFISQGIFMDKALVEDFQANLGYSYVDSETDKDALVEHLLTIDGVVRASTLQTRRNSANTTLSSIRLITLTVKVFAILLALSVIYNLVQLNYSERIRDIATLKVLGVPKFQISKTLIYEISILTLIGSLIGLCFGYPLLYLMLSINEPPMIQYLYRLDLSSYILSVVITFGVSLLINIIMTFKTNSIKMVESLKQVD